MSRFIEIIATPEEQADNRVLEKKVYRSLGVSPDEIKGFRIVRRSLDARKKNPVFRLKIEVFETDEPESNLTEFFPQNVENGIEIIVVGSGPTGLFAAMRLIELGFKPIVLERGKDVSERRKDLSKLHTKHIVNPDSNYCFGEGGAGTYSDGKLYTRSKKRGNLKRVLDRLIVHGASEEIGIDAHPHIGTNKLPKIIASMRNEIRACGGEVHFDARVDDFILESGEMKGVKCGEVSFKGEATVLATGHSARDIFRLLDQKSIGIEAKPFALGVRIEHPQRLIDSIQYSCGTDRGKYLPAASYSLVTQSAGKGVYSFCMCPGGFIVPSATEEGEVVVNGMSTSTRSSKYANSGMVVEVGPREWKKFKQHGTLAAMEFQRSIERNMCALGGNTQTAPGQRMVDFHDAIDSSALNESSYLPGIKPSPLHRALPKSITQPLKEAFKTFDSKMPGYFTNEAQILAVESRTSSPVRIPRDPLTYEHPQYSGLYPGGEGAGYAGGIVSAAIDGEQIANRIANRFKSV